MDKVKRTRKVQIRVNQAEFAELQRRSTRAELGRWMREFCLDEAVPEKRKKGRSVAVDPALLRVIAGLSNNVNQLTRRAHIEGFTDSDPLVQSLGRVDALLQRIVSDDR